jgi:hypothetical protein
MRKCTRSGCKFHRQLLIKKIYSFLVPHIETHSPRRVETTRDGVALSESDASDRVPVGPGAARRAATYQWQPAVAVPRRRGWVGCPRGVVACVGGVCGGCRGAGAGAQTPCGGRLPGGRLRVAGLGSPFPRSGCCFRAREPRARLCFDLSGRPEARLRLVAPRPRPRGSRRGVCGLVLSHGPERAWSGLIPGIWLSRGLPILRGTGNKEHKGRVGWKRGCGWDCPAEGLCMESGPVDWCWSVLARCRDRRSWEELLSHGMHTQSWRWHDGQADVRVGRRSWLDV